LGITPASGPEGGGTAVIIDTKGLKSDFLLEVPEVYFGTAQATFVAGVDADSVSATTPQGPSGGGVVDVEVRAQNGKTARRAAGFTYTPTPTQCTITDVVPGQGDVAGGTIVIITGTGFENDPTTAITFDGTAGTGYQYTSDTQIQCATPAHAAGFVDVRVVSTSRDCTLPGGFEYTTGSPSCSITPPLVPASGPIAGGTSVQISGTDFDAGTTVTFGGIPGSNFAFVSSNQITVDTPPDPLGIPAGGYDVNVCVDTGAGAQCCQPNAFHYDTVALTCTIVDVQPPTGLEAGGNSVTITGSDFDPVPTNNTVNFGAAQATVNAGTADYLDVTAPAGTGTVDVVVTTPIYACTLVSAYTYVQCQGAPCLITGVTPSSGRSGDWVTIMGTDFSTGAAVTFDMAPALAVDYASLPDLLAQVPPSSGPTTVDIHIVNPTGRCCTAAGAFTYTGCVVTNVLPNTGGSGGGTTVIITGGFGVGASPPTVLFGTQPATVVSDDPTTIIVQSPPGTGCVDVIVTDPAGETCSMTSAYCYTECLVTSMTPTAGGTNGGGSATITGDLFDSVVEIRIGPFPGFGYPFVVVDPSSILVTGTTQIDFTLPPGPSGGNVDVEVRNLIKQDSCLVPGGYTYNAPGGGACSITSISPDSGPVAGGTFVTIAGSGFGAPGSTAGVLFGNLQASSVTVVSPTEITCITGPYPGATGRDVDVTVCPATSDPCMLASGFTYIP
jgi:hypothetical protein